MQANTENLKSLPFVEAELTYLAPMKEKAFTYAFDPPAGMPRTNMVFENHRFPIRNLRPIASSVTLDREGFALVTEPSAVKDYYDETELRAVYYGEVEKIVAKVTGAARVVVFDHTIRRRIPGVEDRAPGTPRQPVARIHNDYTEKSGPQRIRDLMGDEAEALLKKRYAFINLWRPIRGPLLDKPLAMADARSFEDGDFVTQDLIYKDRHGEIYSALYRPGHRWFYVPAMAREEALLIKCFDTLRDGTARFSAHTAFEDPTTPADASPRESIEIRTIAFFD